MIEKKIVTTRVERRRDEIRGAERNQTREQNQCELHLIECRLLVRGSTGVQMRESLCSSEIFDSIETGLVKFDGLFCVMRVVQLPESSRTKKNRSARLATTVRVKKIATS